MNLSKQSFAVAVDAGPNTSTLIHNSLHTKCINIANEKDWNFYTQSGESAPFAVFINIEKNPLGTDLELIEQALTAWPVSPVIGIADRYDDKLVEEALAAGAHDFIAKPLRPAEIRSRTLSRRKDITGKQGHTVISLADLMLDTERAVLHGPQEKTYLSRNEALIISFLMNSFEAIVPRQTIKQFVWKDLKVTDNALNRKIFDVKHIVNNTSCELILSSVYGKGIVLHKKSQPL